MPAAVSVPGEPKGAPVNDSMAAADGHLAARGGRRVDPGVGPSAASGSLHGRSFHRTRMNRKGVGERPGGGARVAVAREDVHDHVRRFEANREAAGPAAGVPCAGIEGPVRFQHRDGAEVEVPLPVRALLAHLLDDVRRLPHGVPVDAIVARHDEVCAQAVARRRQDLGQQIDRRGVVGVLQHCRTDVGAEAQPRGQIVDSAEQRQGVSVAESPRVLGERLRRDADAGHVVPRRFDSVPHLAEEPDGFFDLRGIGLRVDRDEAGDRAHLRLRLVGRGRRRGG